MVDINITVSGRYTGTVKINAWLLNKRTNIATGLRKAGGLVSNKAKQFLSGPSHTYYGKQGMKIDNPYPGVLTGKLRRTMMAKMDADGLAVRIGPNVVYARIHEFGGMAGRNLKTRIPARPYLTPAFKAVHRQVFDIFRNQIMKAIR